MYENKYYPKGTRGEVISKKMCQSSGVGVGGWFVFGWLFVLIEYLDV